MSVCKFQTALQKVDGEIVKLQPGDVDGLRRLRWKRRLIVRKHRAARSSGRKRKSVSE